MQGGRLYVGCDIFSRDYALPSGTTWVKNDLIVGGGREGGGVPEEDSSRSRNLSHSATDR